MANIVFKFKHPDLIDEDFYFVYNTFFELPVTIPMDLASYFIFELEVGTNWAWLDFGWDNLIKNGCSLTGESFEMYFDENEKTAIYDDARYSFSIQQSKLNKDISENLKIFINEKKYISQDIRSYLIEFGEKAYKHFRPILYYYSRHELLDYFWENEDFDITEVDIFNKDVLIELYLKQPFPLYIIPHKYRLDGFFKTQFIIKKNFTELPDIYQNKSLILELCEMVFPNELPFFIGEELSNNRDFMLEAIQINGSMLGNASNQLKNDRMFVLKAIASYPFAFEHASDELKNDVEIAIVAIEA